MSEENKGDNASNKDEEDLHDHQDPEDVKAKPEICPMKRGDYMVHIYIEQAKKLKVEAGDTVDPLVEVACMGSKKFTTAK